MRLVRFFIKSFAILLCAVVICIVGSIGVSYFFIENKTTHEAAPEETQFIDIGEGEEIAYQEIVHPSSAAIVFVGGLSGWSGTWQRSMKQLDTELVRQGQPYTLIALDLPPFGYSTADLSKGFFRIEQADRIQRFLEKKKLNNVIFVAHSYGAGPVMEMVMSDSSKIRKVVVVDGVLNIDDSQNIKDTSYPLGLFELFIHAVSHHPFLIKDRLKQFVYIQDHIDSNLVDLYAQPFVVRGNSKRLAYWLRDYLVDTLNVKSTRSSEYLKLTFPMRIIWGDMDTLTPLVLGQELFEYVKNGKMYTLHNVGHIPMIEDYKQFDAALLQAILE